MLEQAAVVALVNEETRLLSAQPVNVETQTVFKGLVGGETSYYIIVLGVEPGLIGQCGLRFIVNGADAGFGKRHERAGYLVACIMHSR